VDTLAVVATIADTRDVAEVTTGAAMVDTLAVADIVAAVVTLDVVEAVTTVPKPSG
jgi:hypothetical protein